MQRIARVVWFPACLALALVSACEQGPDARQEQSDVALTAEVSNRFERDTELTNYDLQVTTQDGVVTLTGRVADERQRTDAARIAHEVAGVKQVVNRVVADPAVGGSAREEAS